MVLPVVISSLATELVELIAAQLGPADVLALRLTCRDIEGKTFRFFCSQFFRFLRTDLSRSSLARIDALSKHPQFRPYVQGLALVLGKGVVGRDLAWKRHPWGPLAAPLQIEEIRNLRDNLVQRLVNCRSFCITCRYPEGRPDLTRMTLSDAVAIFFALIADSKLPVKYFHLNYASVRSRSLSMDMRRLPPLALRHPGFTSAWSHLEHFFLDQHLTLESFPLLLDLILSAPDLKTLSLNLSCQDLSAGFINELALSESLPRLQQLGLSRTLVQANDLQTILYRLADSLRALDLNHVNVMSGGSWDAVFGSLKTGFPLLETLSLSYLRVASPDCEFITFPAIEKKLKNLQSSILAQKCKLIYSDGKAAQDLVGIEYSGPDISSLLDIL